MRDKIIKIFSEIKKKKVSEELDPTKQLIDQPNDDFRQHTLQKPIQTGYSQNQP